MNEDNNQECKVVAFESSNGACYGYPLYTGHCTAESGWKTYSTQSKNDILLYKREVDSSDYNVHLIISVNIKAGGQTKFSGIIHSLILLLIILVLSPIASTIPLSVLAAILIKVGIDIIDWEFFKNLRIKSKLEILTTFLVIFLTVFINLIIAVFAGVLFYFVLKLILNKD
jgi:hypothetical protein